MILEKTYLFREAYDNVSHMAKAVFLDRDETLNPDSGYINDPARFSLYPWVPGELARLKAHGFKLIVVSNQSGINRGLITWDQLTAIHAKLDRELKRLCNIQIDLYEVCPHRPDEACPCRKPSPKLILDGIKKLDLNPRESYMIGDRKSDFEAGVNANLKQSYLVEPGDEVSFKAIVETILKNESK